MAGIEDSDAKAEGVMGLDFTRRPSDPDLHLDDEDDRSVDDLLEGFAPDLIARLALGEVAPR